MLFMQEHLCNNPAFKSKEAEVDVSNYAVCNDVIMFIFCCFVLGGFK